MPDLRSRLLARSEVTALGCREWQGARFPNGYGKITVGSVRDGTRCVVGVHRVAFEEFVGEIPAGLGVLHSCDNRPCIEPTHLFVGSDLDNARDRDTKGRYRHPSRSAENETRVMAIRWLMAEGLPRAAVARMFGVSPDLVSRIARGRRWPHLPVLAYPERRGGYWSHA